MSDESSKLASAEQQSVLMWSIALILSIGLLAMVWLLAKPLALFFLAVTIAAAFSPIVELIETRLPRLAAVLSVYAALIVLLLLIVLVTLPPVIQQGTQLGERLPEFVDDITLWLDDNGILGDDLADMISSQLGEIGPAVFALPLALFGALTDIFLIFIISLYLLLDAERLQRLGLSLFPSGKRERVEDVSGEMLRAVGGYVRGVTINIAIIAVIASIGLTIIGVNFAVVLGIFAGFMEIFPIVGPFIGAIPILLVALIQSPTIGLIAFIFVLTLQLFEGNVLMPNIMHLQAKVPPYVVLFALLAGGALGGVLGAITAIPLAAALKVFVLRVLMPEIRKYTYANAQ